VEVLPQFAMKNKRFLALYIALHASLSKIGSKLYKLQQLETFLQD